MVEPVEPSELDLVTIKSEPAQASIDSHAYEMTTTWRGYLMWACAAVVAIILGIIPALWINRWRAEARTDKPRATAAEMTAEPIVEPGPPPAPAPATAPQPTLPAEIEIDEPRAEPTKKRPAKRAVRPAKRPVKPGKTCDVYLHPHGCPR